MMRAAVSKKRLPLSVCLATHTFSCRSSKSQWTRELVAILSSCRVADNLAHHLPCTSVPGIPLHGSVAYCQTCKKKPHAEMIPQLIEDVLMTVRASFFCWRLLGLIPGGAPFSQLNKGVKDAVVESTKLVKYQMTVRASSVHGMSLKKTRRDDPSSD